MRFPRTEPCIGQHSAHAKRPALADERVDYRHGARTISIRCAIELRDAVRELGVELRSGLHTGECEAIGDDVGGLAVHIGARVGSLAAPREVLVSNTVKDLVVGSGIDFKDRGEHALKGVPGRWRLWAAQR